MKTVLITILLMAIIATSEVHYHYYGTSPVPKNHKLFSKSNFCEYAPQASKFNILAKSKGWHCQDAWENCTQVCSKVLNANKTSNCTWTCSKKVNEVPDQSYAKNSGSKLVTK